MLVLRCRHLVSYPHILLNLAIPALVGLLTTGIIQVLKAIPTIPLVAGQTAKIRTVARRALVLGNFGKMIDTFAWTSP